MGAACKLLAASLAAIKFPLIREAVTKMEEEAEIGAVKVDSPPAITSTHNKCCSSFYLSCRQFVLLLGKNFLLQVRLAGHT